MLHPHIPVRDFHSAYPSLSMSQAQHIIRTPMSLTIFTFYIERLPYCKESTSKSSQAAGRTKTESPLAHSRHTSLAIRQQNSLSVFRVSTSLASTQQSGKPNLPSIGPSSPNPRASITHGARMTRIPSVMTVQYSRLQNRLPSRAHLRICCPT